MWMAHLINDFMRHFPGLSLCPKQRLLLLYSPSPPSLCTCLSDGLLLWPKTTTWPSAHHTCSALWLPVWVGDAETSEKILISDHMLPEIPTLRSRDYALTKGHRHPYWDISTSKDNMETRTKCMATKLLDINGSVTYRDEKRKIWRVTVSVSFGLVTDIFS